jgi:hypothetical protein
MTIELRNSDTRLQLFPLDSRCITHSLVLLNIKPCCHFEIALRLSRHEQSLELSGHGNSRSDLQQFLVVSLETLRLISLLNLIWYVSFGFIVRFGESGLLRAGQNSFVDRATF